MSTEPPAGGFCAFGGRVGGGILAGGAGAPTRRPTIPRYICTQCGYIYDPKKGDPMNGIPAGTAFEDLPDEWVCPMCYATKDMFDPLD